MTTKTIKINNLTAVNEAAWYKDATDRLQGLSVKARWALKKNLNTLGKIANDFQEFKANEEKPLFDKYGDDKHSFIEGDLRKIKDEYLPEYQKEVEKVNEKLYEILADEVEVTLNVIDIDEEVEKMADDAKITDADLDMLSLFMSE